MSDQNLEAKLPTVAPQTEDKQLIAKLLDDTEQRPTAVTAASGAMDNGHSLFLSGGLQANPSDLAMAVRNNPYLLDDPYVRRALEAQFGIKPTDKPDVQSV